LYLLNTVFWLDHPQWSMIQELWINFKTFRDEHFLNTSLLFLKHFFWTFVISGASIILLVKLLPVYYCYPFSFIPALITATSIYSMFLLLEVIVFTWSRTTSHFCFLYNFFYVAGMLKYQNDCLQFEAWHYRSTSLQVYI